MAKKHMYLYGRNSVLERIRARPESIQKVYIREGLSLPDIEKAMRKQGIREERLSAEALDRMRPQKDLQGVVAQVGLYAYTPADDVVDDAIEEGTSLLILDRVNDPHNLGVIIRLAACFGGFAIVIPSREACQVNETVLHVASGGENYVPIASVNNLAPVIDSAKKRGFWIAGAMVEEGAADISETTFPFPLALVLGSEGAGVRKGLHKRMDLRVSIPMHGAPLSFNVSQACAIFCHEISRQRRSS